MSGTELYRDPDEDIREAERRDAAIERHEAMNQERGHGEGADDNLEPSPTDEGSGDNDGGPPAD